jgi:predicted RND superfamily exporter protein
MGAIMCIGVSVSNSVMLVTFTDERWKAGLAPREAAVAGAASRLRPILMTACAMTIGTIPMALALEEGSEMTAPLGRAVIGGLVVSTMSTLLVLPAVFAIVMGKSQSRSPSVHPDDPESAHYDPDALAEQSRTAAVNVDGVHASTSKIPVEIPAEPHDAVHPA